jgi:hypothetical protein
VTRSVWASRFAFPDPELVQNPKEPPSSGTIHTGELTGVPSRRKVVKHMYFSSVSAIVGM